VRNRHHRSLESDLLSGAVGGDFVIHMDLLCVPRFLCRLPFSGKGMTLKFRGIREGLVPIHVFVI
jgi:hypothetical protein